MPRISAARRRCIMVSLSCAAGHWRVPTLVFEEADAHDDQQYLRVMGKPPSCCCVKVQNLTRRIKMATWPSIRRLMPAYVGQQSLLMQVIKCRC